MATNFATIEKFFPTNHSKEARSAPPTTPSKIWICVAGKELPAWIVERMTTADVAADGSFDIDASDGVVTVQPGFAVFAFGEQVFACPPRLVQAKLAAAAGDGHPIVEQLRQKAEAVRAQSRSQKPGAMAEAKLSGRKELRIKPVNGTPPAPQFVGVDQLQVDDSYQRSIEGGSSQKLIVNIAENWNWQLCLPLLCSRREGNLYVIDGQHRLEAARLRGDIQHMPVVVFDFDDPRAEAELFVAANRSRRAMSKLDDFHAAVVAGDVKAIAVSEVVSAAGLAVGRIQAWQYWKPGEVVFVKAIQRALHTQGKAVVEQALGTIARAFSGLVLTGVGAVFEALCTLISQRAKEGSPIDLALMERVLSEVGIPGWKEATEGVDSGQERAEVMLKALIEAYVEGEAF